MVLSYVLYNLVDPILEFALSEIPRGHMAIKCADLVFLDFLTSSEDLPKEADDASQLLRDVILKEERNCQKTGISTNKSKRITANLTTLIN